MLTVTKSPVHTNHSERWKSFKFIQVQVGGKLKHFEIESLHQCLLSWFFLSPLTSIRAVLDQLVRYLRTHQMKHDLLLHWPVTMLDWMVRKKTGHTLNYILTSSWFITDEACIRSSFHCMMDLIALLRKCYFLPNDCRDWCCSMLNWRLFVNSCVTGLDLLLQNEQDRCLMKYF